MADLNNTIQAIEHCANGGYCIRCKLRDDRRCDAITSCKTLLTDALELLKEKKPKSPTWRRGKAFCGGCGGCLENKEQHSSDIVSSIRFCKWCGTPVDWSNE